VDETKAYEHRILDAIEGTDVTVEQFMEKRLYFARQNLKGDLETVKYFGLKLTPWHSEDETPYPDAEDILIYLRGKGYKIGVIANQPIGTAGRLEEYGLLRYVDVVAASAELGVAKPDKIIFNKALEMAGCTANESVMIGDRLDNDIIPAKELGMKTIWIRQGFAVYQNPHLSDEQPDYTVDNLLELKKIL
jgi:HAD superfamily hydrolase (TIGR01662 family)